MTAQQTYAHDLTIRRLGAADAGAVQRLAELEGRPAPTGALLGAVVGDRLLAVVPLEAGQSLADPFAASGEALALAEMRAAQMRGGSGSRLRGLRRLRGRRQGTARGTLAGSPPGGGGRLLQL
jgi:hypothetical protein